MNKVNINRTKLSELVWKTIFESSGAFFFTPKQELIDKSNMLDQLRDMAKYNTGSITSAAIWTLFSMVNQFKPKIIAEVGTFIGKSTFAMACSLDINSKDGGEIYTCDYSNSIKLNFDTKTIIHQYQMKSSTEMFMDLKNKNIKCDFLVLDGRLQEADFEILNFIMHEDTIIVLDDFEGTEKGVINAIRLMDSLNKTHLLIYPPTTEIIRSNGLNTSCTVAMIIPVKSFIYTNQ